MSIPWLSCWASCQYIMRSAQLQLLVVALSPLYVYSRLRGKQTFSVVIVDAMSSEAIPPSARRGDASPSDPAGGLMEQITASIQRGCSIWCEEKDEPAPSAKRVPQSQCPAVDWGPTLLAPTWSGVDQPASWWFLSSNSPLWVSGLRGEMPPRELTIALFDIFATLT